MLPHLCLTTVLSALALSSGALAQGRESRWSGAGSWVESAGWSAGLPDALTRARLTGHGALTLGGGRQIVGGLLVGTGPGDDARLHIAGGELIVRRTMLQIGEMQRGAGEVVIEGGALHCIGPIYLGGANSAPDRACRGTLRIRGGSVSARMLALGWGQGADATLAIEGSRATAVHLLDYLTLGTYLAGPPSTCTLAFTLDDRGVTPITIESAKGYLQITRAPVKNSCRLRIALSAVPPRGEVTLIAAHSATRGEFDALPEGAEIAADIAGRSFRWTLTYRGGAGGCDLVLTKVRGHTADDPVTETRAIPPPPKLLWTEVPLRPPLPDDLPPAFAGAEGFGASARGGRDGREITVTNLEDSGPGSLRAALAEKGARRIVFGVGGTVVLRSALVLREPFVSILGQTAAAPGITLRGSGVIVQTHDVVLQHLRIRPGDDAAERDALEFYDAERCIVDHCSLSWGTDETCSVVGLSDAITIQHCLLSESLDRAGHSMAAIAGGERVTWHHNLFAHCGSRNPRFAMPTLCDFRNNVIYDWGHTAGYGEFERVNFVANFYRPGPSTRQRPPRFLIGESTALPATLFAAGNILDGDAEATRDNWRAITYDRRTGMPAPFPAPPVATEDALTAYARVLENAGATLPQRDAIDARVIEQVRTRTGRIPRTVAEAGAK